MKRILLIAILAVAAGAAGFWWWRAGATQAAVAAALPRTVDLSAANDATRDRLAEAEAKARSRFQALAGLKELSRIYHANGFLAEAEACYRVLQQLEPREGRWPHLLATIVAGYGDMPPALELWRKVQELSPDYLPAWLRSGDGYLKANQLDAAAAAYNAALKLDRDNPYALLGLARLDLEAGRLEAARQRLEQIVTKTNYTLGYDLIVSLYERLGLAQKATAIRAMAKASGAYRDPADPWLDGLIEDCLDPYRLSLTAGTIARNGDGPGALKLLQRAVSVAPDDVSVRFQLGTLLVQQGRPDEAQEQLVRCTTLSPDFADGWAHLTSLLANQGRMQAADQALADGLRNCPDSPGLHLMLARKHRAAGRNAEAIVEFQQSIRLRPNEADAYIELGNFYISLGRDAEGIAQITQALQAEPGNPTAISVLAYQAIMTADEAEARSWLARARSQPRVESDQISRLAAAFQKRFGHSP